MNRTCETTQSFDRRSCSSGLVTITRLSLPIGFVVSLVAILLPSPSLAQWAKTIDCPDGTVYRDVRRDAGRDEFCERVLPGALKVQHGPSRWWYSQGHLGEEGHSSNGRQVGRWKECDRFGRCQVRVHELTSPEERARGVKAEVPVAFANGKYVFDFGSCWSTWVTRQTSDSFVELNIVSGLTCQITYIPSTEKDRAAGNRESYLCEVPYSVWIRAFDSVNLRSELPEPGCRNSVERIPAGNRTHARRVFGTGACRLGQPELPG